MTDKQDLIREIHEYVTTHGGENTATHLLVQAASAIQTQAAELEAVGAGGVQALSAAPVEVADAMADSQYLAGVSAGWNAANADDPNEALRKLHESRAGYLKPICTAARAPADSVLEDAARYRFLAGHCRSTSEHWGGRWSIIVDGPAPKSHDSEDDFDEAVDAARKQGAKP